MHNVRVCICLWVNEVTCVCHAAANKPLPAIWLIASVIITVVHHWLMCFPETYWLLLKRCGKRSLSLIHYRRFQDIHRRISFNIHHILFSQWQIAVLTQYWSLWLRDLGNSMLAKTVFFSFFFVTDSPSNMRERANIVFKAVFYRPESCFINAVSIHKTWIKQTTFFF